MNRIRVRPGKGHGILSNLKAGSSTVGRKLTIKIYQYSSISISPRLILGIWLRLILEMENRRVQGPVG